MLCCSCWFCWPRTLHHFFPEQGEKRREAYSTHESFFSFFFLSPFLLSFFFTFFLFTALINERKFKKYISRCVSLPFLVYPFSYTFLFQTTSSVPCYNLPPPPPPLSPYVRLSNCCSCKHAWTQAELSTKKNQSAFISNGARARTMHHLYYYCRL